MPLETAVSSHLLRLLEHWVSSSCFDFLVSRQTCACNIPDPRRPHAGKFTECMLVKLAGAFAPRDSRCEDKTISRLKKRNLRIAARCSGAPTVFDVLGVELMIRQSYLFEIA